MQAPDCCPTLASIRMKPAPVSRASSRRSLRSCRPPAGRAQQGLRIRPHRAGFPCRRPLPPAQLPQRERAPCVMAHAAARQRTFQIVVKGGGRQLDVPAAPVVVDELNLMGVRGQAGWRRVQGRGPRGKGPYPCALARRDGVCSMHAPVGAAPPAQRDEPPAQRLRSCAAAHAWNGWVGGGPAHRVCEVPLAGLPRQLPVGQAGAAGAAVESLGGTGPAHEPPSGCSCGSLNTSVLAPMLALASGLGRGCAPAPWLACKGSTDRSAPKRAPTAAPSGCAAQEPRT